MSKADLIAENQRLTSVANGYADLSFAAASDLADLEKENQLLKERLAEAEKVIKFYSNEETGPLKPVEFCAKVDQDLNDPEIGFFIRSDDFEYVAEDLIYAYGKRAKEYRKKWGV